MLETLQPDRVGTPVEQSFVERDYEGVTAHRISFGFRAHFTHMDDCINYADLCHAGVIDVKALGEFTKARSCLFDLFGSRGDRHVEMSRAAFLDRTRRAAGGRMQFCRTKDCNLRMAAALFPSLV
ncbi:hypothetical protein WG907_02425 [Sphingobium sp. AN558]|uniref:hypothetical protein n=1 Tax=Sphingobium sp. AN558 TaxID=3133442 RepID=UPI0030BF9F64